VSNNLNLSIARLGDLNVVAEVSDAALDLDAVVQELLESGDVEDLVAGRLGGVDDVLLLLAHTIIKAVARGGGTYLGGNLLRLLGASLSRIHT
jgi:hypothetical protein